MGCHWSVRPPLEWDGMQVEAQSGISGTGSATQLVVKELSSLPFPGKGGDGKMMVQYLGVKERVPLKGTRNLNSV